MSQTSHTVPSFGPLLRDWRQRRRITQLDLSLDANISTRHLSFLETGRARPSREMVMRLAEELGVPIRERNALLTSAGFAPAFTERSLDDPSLSAARQAVDLVLKGHVPYPAIAVDRHWILVAANDAVPQLLVGVDAELLRAPANVMRIALHPKGLAPRIANLWEWRDHLLERVRRQVAMTADPVLAGLLAELTGYPVPARQRPQRAGRDYAGMVVPLELVTDAGLLALFSTLTVFGTPVDVTLSELALECFYPADDSTAEILRRTADRRRGAG